MVFPINNKKNINLKRLIFVKKHDFEYYCLFFVSFKIRIFTILSLLILRASIFYFKNVIISSLLLFYLISYIQLSDLNLNINQSAQPDPSQIIWFKCILWLPHIFWGFLYFLSSLHFSLSSFLFSYPLNIYILLNYLFIIYV